VKAQEKEEETAMAPFNPGLVHTPLTPFKGKRVDFDTYAKIIDFHIANGADAIAVPMNAGESVSLPEKQKREVIGFAIKQAGGRVPVIAHASDSGTSIAAERAALAEDAGAAAIVASTPYYWTPPPAAMIEHFAAIAGAVRIPFLVHNAPDEMSGIRVNAELMLKLIDKAENFVGVVDSGLDWQFMIELITYAPKKRPDFQLVSGVEYMVSAGAIGSKALFAPLAGVAPKLVRSMFDDCVADRLFEARKAQEDVAALRFALKGLGVGGLKAAAKIMGRDCGEPRAPLEAIGRAQARKLADALGAIAPLGAEPRGW
jgi:4-hydroxy-tetrahydrodipicolinate synthase